MSPEKTTAPRNVGFDLARAFAVFGMVIVNFKIAMGAGENGPSWLIRAAGLLEGRAAATFVVLAGIGLSLLSRKARLSGDSDLLIQARRTVLSRALFLFLGGLLYAPIWPADILHFYGVYLAIAAFFLAAPTWKIWSAAVGAVLAFVGMILALDYELGWDWSTLEYEGFWTLSGMLRHLFFNGFHPVIPWVAFVLIGLYVGRLDLTQSIVRRWLFVFGAGVAAIAEGLSWIFLSVTRGVVSPEDQDVLNALFGTAPMPPMPLYMAAGAGTACAVIAATSALGERFADKAWLQPLVATGQLALTLYVAHVLVGMGTLEALGWLKGQTLKTSLMASMVFCGCGVIFAYVWRLKYQRGPVEIAMRAVTDRMTATYLSLRES